MYTQGSVSGPQNQIETVTAKTGSIIAGRYQKAAVCVGSEVQ